MGMFRAAKTSITASQVWRIEAPTWVATRGAGVAGGVRDVQPASNSQGTAQRGLILVGRSRRVVQRLTILVSEFNLGLAHRVR